MIGVRLRAVRIGLRIRHARRRIAAPSRRGVARANRRPWRQLLLALADLPDEKRREDYRGKDERDRNSPHERKMK